MNHFIINCPRFANERQKLPLKIEKIVPDIFGKTVTCNILILPYGDPSFSVKRNINILNLSTDYISYTKRFESAIFRET